MWLPPSCRLPSASGGLFSAYVEARGALRSEAAGRQMSVARRLVHDLLDVIVTDKPTRAILDD